MLDAAFGWIGQVVEWFGRFIPRREILDMTQGAVKYRHGNEPIVCGPGVHWWWPWTTTWTWFPTARQADRLETQTMETKDGQTIIVGGLLVHSVEDIKALVTTTYSPAATVKEIALSAVHDVCCSMDWAVLKEEQRKGTLDTKLKNAAQRELKDYGVKIIKLMLTSLARCRVYKISQSTSNEETS